MFHRNISSVVGNIVNIRIQTIGFGRVIFQNGKIVDVHIDDPTPNPDAPFIMPGFIDAHVHIESSLLIPSEFARMAVVHGTVATISDPHEIANVCGMKGITFMIENGKTVPFKFHFGAPSCVPATTFETAGDEITVQDIHTLLQRDDIFYLSEMMNFPGVLHGNKEVMEKISAAKQYNKPVDGHAPGLRGNDAKTYCNAGISTDHECFTEPEAAEKLSYGMKILIREGSAAKNFEALAGLIDEHYENMMFCSDDKHPDSLLEGHINQLCARAVSKGIDLYKVLKMACINPVEHYNMQVGLLNPGDNADFIMVKDLKDFKVLQTYINGKLVADAGKTLIRSQKTGIINNFSVEKISPNDLIVQSNGKEQTLIIGALDGQLITEKINYTPPIQNNNWITNPADDILKIVVVNRYKASPIAKAFIKNFGLTTGAIASSVAHDSHNIVAVGVDDESLAKAINLVIQQQGGLSAVSPVGEEVLPLPVAGLMSNLDGYKIAEDYTKLDKKVKEEMGSKLRAPFMTLSFMALLVIPHLKLSDKGLFDGDSFSFV
ncbi:MAG: adenine deaminase [Ferruginibacter sp.]|nr:adenine deaminase [Ferruginibacter sp.]